MEGPIAISLGTALIGLFLILANKMLKRTLSFFSAQGLGTMLDAAGYVLCGLGIIAFIFSVMTKATSNPEKKTTEEQKPIEVYICPYCEDKFESREVLDKHITEKHHSEKEEVEKPKKVPLEPKYNYLP